VPFFWGGTREKFDVSKNAIKGRMYKHFCMPLPTAVGIWPRASCFSRCLSVWPYLYTLLVYLISSSAC